MGKASVVAPAQLRSSRFAIDDEEYVVVSYPLPTLRAPLVLSRAEQLVAVEFASGRSMRAIATLRSTSIRTVANQIQSIYRKLGIQSRLELTERLSK